MLLFHVFVYLGPEQLALIRAVCRQWQTVADRNALWRPFCARRWPSSVTPAMQQVLQRPGGYAAYFRQAMPRRRSRLDDFIFTIDVVSRTQEGGIPVERAIAGTAIPGGAAGFDAAIDPDNAAGAAGCPAARCRDAVLVAQLGTPWQVSINPWFFQPLTDIALGEPARLHARWYRGWPNCTPPPQPAPDNHADAALWHARTFPHPRHTGAGPEQQQQQPPPPPPELGLEPELRLRCSVVHRPSMRTAHLVTAHEGLALRSRKYYERRAEATGAEDMFAAMSAGGAEWIGFSGQLHLPQQANNGMEHTVDLFLVGGKLVSGAGTTHYSFTEARIGPLFAHGAIGDEPTGDSLDFLEMLDLKLGLYNQQVPTELGANTL